MRMKKDGSEACAKSVFRTVCRTKNSRRRKTPNKSNYQKDSNMQSFTIAQANLMASVATVSPSVPGLTTDKFLAALENNNVATFSANAAQSSLKGGKECITYRK